MGIKNKISLIVSLLFGVLLIAAGALLVNLSEDKIRQSITTQQAALVKTLAYGFDQQVLARHHALINVAEGLSAEMIRHPTQLQTFLQEQIALPKLFTNILVYAPDGTIIGAYPSPEKYVGSKRLAGMEYVQHTLETQKPYISKLFVSPVSGEPLIVMTAPVFDDDGKLIAMLGGSQYILRDNLFSGFTANRIGQTGNLVLITRERVVIAHPDKSRVMQTLPVGANMGVEHAIEDGQYAGETVSSLGVPGLMTIQTMSTTGWLAGAQLPLEEAYEPVAQMRRHAFQVIIVLLLILPALVWLTMSVLTRPLLALRDRIQNMASHPHEENLIAWQRDDEIGELAEAFDHLTLARRHAEAGQIRLNRSLRLLSDCNQTLIHTEDENHLLRDICQLIIKTGGYPFAWVGYAQEDKVLRPVATAGTGVAYLEQQIMSWDEGSTICEIGRMAIETSETQICPDIQNSPHFVAWKQVATDHGYRSAISLPLKSESGAFGILNIYASESEAFSADEVKLLEELAADLTFGIVTLRARTAHRTAEGELAFLAHHDPLTKLPNRLLLRDRFEQAIAHAQRDYTRVAVLFLDLDNFKEINDSLGHAIGDDLLISVVQRLQNTLRQADTISREGGDEFVVLLTGVNSTNDISRVAQTILDAMVIPFEIEGHTLHTSFSIGISIYPNDGSDFDTVRKNADTALYRAKDSGRRNYRFFAGQMNIDAQMRMQMQIDLRKALQNKEFCLHYQPQIHLASGRIVGSEALIRWQRNGALVSPMEFIPVAEHSGLIIPIGEWVLNEACQQAVKWQQKGLPELVVAVNLSALQFKHGNIIDTVTQALANAGLAPHLLELELTESILLQDVEVAMDILKQLHKLGVKLSIDDFGTGYSSLSYLKRLSVDKLKIDKSFVHDLAKDSDDAAIIKAIIQLSHTLQLEVIAEGVETAEQLAFLRESGCDEAQGYFFSRPVSADLFPQVFSAAQK
ncbi:MAG TPA: EAL domain-containing protein [Rhodocyclaceae bacterium]|nr:EAL domain-containing protein [Rhodocyclaceae bacterium]